MAKLFLSYSRKDALRAQRFTEWLERHGHDVWRDEDDIRGGASFSNEIEEALEDCDAVLVLWSLDSVRSPWVRDEAGYGRDHGKLIPLALDGTLPPLGFRQFQSIDLAKWKGRGEPPRGEQILRAIGTADHEPDRGRAIFAAPALASASRNRRSASRVLGLSVIVLAFAAVAFLAWRNLTRNHAIVIAVSPSPTSPDRATADDYANVTAADMASFLPSRFDRATVIASVASSPKSAYRVLISANRHGNGADASLTLSDIDGRTILWSKSWSVPDSSAIDLRQEVSLAASRAALCLTEARGGVKRLSQPALSVYVNGCVGVNDADWSDDQLLTVFERVTKLAPDFPRGWAYLAIGRAQVAEALGPADSEAKRKAREAIAMARHLNPRSGLAYMAESILASTDHFRALELLNKGVAVEPDNSLLQMFRADSLRSVGRMDESVQAARRGVELDPLSPFTRANYILAITYAGQFSRAKAELADARKKWPNNAALDQAEFAFQYRYGNPRAAEALLPRVLQYSDAQLARYGRVLAAREDPTSAKVDAAIASWDEPDGPDRNKQLLALGLFGKTNEAYHLLADPKFQAVVSPDILFRPEFAKVRADARFMPLAARLGLVRYWRESGRWPDFCSSEQLPYDCRKAAGA